MLSGPLKRSDLHRIRKVYFALFSTFGKQSAAVLKIRIMASFLACSPPDRADCHTTASVSTLPLPPSSHAFGSHRAPRDSRCLGPEEPHPTTSWRVGLVLSWLHATRASAPLPPGHFRAPDNPQGSATRDSGVRQNSYVGSTARVLIVPISVPFATGLMHNSDTSITEQRQQHTVHRSPDPLLADLAIGRPPDAALTNKKRPVALQPAQISQRILAPEARSWDGLCLICNTGTIA